MPLTCQDRSENEVSFLKTLNIETNSISLLLVMIEAKTNLVRIIVRSKTKRTACPQTSTDQSENDQVVPKFWNKVKRRELAQLFQNRW